jgi:hypothetical protein
MMRTDVPSTTTTSGDTYSDDETHVDSPELGDNNYRDYSGLRMKQHPFQVRMITTNTAQKRIPTRHSESECGPAAVFCVADS